MTAFVPGQTVRSRSPTVEVDPLDAGRWRFQLVVLDDERNASEPAELVVEVLRRGVTPPPPPVFDPRILTPIPRRPIRPIR